MRALQATALIVTTALALTGLQQTFTEPPTTTISAPAAPNAAEAFATAATAAFAGTPLASNPTLNPAERAAGIPTDPAASWPIPTADGRHVELVLPGGLGTGEATPAGQVVYPDRGAGFEVLAENTGTTRRTITRIASAPEPVASGARRLPTVTMFVRTPADTALNARTDGALTLTDTTTPSAQPIAGIAPAAARDSRGAIVPSAFVTTQIKPGLYLLAQVIDPGPDTAFPVYADPSLWDDVSSLASSAWNSTTAAASTAWQTSVDFVKENPVESVMIAGGTVLVATGVGSGFGVSLITGGATSLTQKTLQATDNAALQTAGDLIEIGGYLNPTRSVLKGVDDLGAQLFKHTDDITPTVPVTPTNLAGPATKPAQPPAKPGVDTPQAPHAPPAAKTPEPATPLATKPCAGQSFSPDTPVLLADGSSQPISQLRIGQQVLSSDPATGWTGAQPIQAVLVNHDTDLLDLTIANNLGAQAVIHTTAGHPFYRPATDTITRTAATTGTTLPGTASAGGDWVDAGHLQVGDPLHTPGDLPHTPDTSGARLAASTGVPGTADMWDLTIATTHTFYIHTPTADILVHNCPTPEVPKTPKPEQPEGGVYVVRDANGNVAYTGRASNIDQRLYTHAGPGKHAKLEPGDTVQKYRTDNPAIQRGLEQIKIDQHNTLRRVNPGGRNRIRGVGERNPRAGAYEKAGKRYLNDLRQEPEFTQLPERVQRRLDGQVRAQRSAEAQRSTAQNNAREANQSGTHRSSDSGSQSGGRSSDKKNDDKTDKKGSKQHHPRPNGK